MGRTKNLIDDTNSSNIDYLRARIEALSNRNKELVDIIEDDLKRLDEAAKLLEKAVGVTSIMHDELKKYPEVALDILGKVEEYLKEK